MSPAEAIHHGMIDQLIARGSLWSAALIAAFRATPRHYFVDRLWHARENRWHSVDVNSPSEEDLTAIYQDRAITTHWHASQTAISSSSQPSLMAGMLEDLRLRPGQKILEIGTGTGYNAALLAHVVGSVYSIDVDSQVLADAHRHLAWFPDRQVHLLHGDGRLGWPEFAPFDRIQVTAATDDLEPAWLEQLVPGGLVQVPVDFGPGLAWILQGTVQERQFLGGLTRSAFFLPLREETEPGRDRSDYAVKIHGPDGLEARPAPWEKWQDLRQREIAEMLTSLAFFAWLEGKTLGYVSLSDGRYGHGLAEGNAICWLGPQFWYVHAEGYKLGIDLWRRWLDLGAPRATDWRMRCVESGRSIDAISSARASYYHQGRCCNQYWELIEPRHPGCRD